MDWLPVFGDEYGDCCDGACQDCIPEDTWAAIDAVLNEIGDMT
jgi:hypothetical protein